VLSNQATPNTLSTMGTSGRGMAPPTGPSSAPARPAVVRPTPTRPIPSDPRVAAPDARRRRLPSIGTLITIGFLIFWATRFLNNLDLGSSSPTTAPAPPGSVAAGVVTFGSTPGQHCDITDVADHFAVSADVWWRAELTATQPEDATVVVRAYHDEGQIDRYEIPPDEGSGEWAILCPGDPIAAYQPGSYRLEVWDEAEKTLLAVGRYTKSPEGATYRPLPTLRPTTSRSPGSSGVSPEPTLVHAVAGRVTFGTALDADCRLAGQSDRFEPNDVVWWRAELNQAVPTGMTVRLFALLNGGIVTDQSVPASALIDDRKVVCAWSPVAGAATVSYVVQLWTPDREIMLANGNFFRNP
jgi:hypothetical protein